MPDTMSGSQRPSTPQDVFSTVAGYYDRMNALASLGADRRWRSEAARPLATTEPIDVLDLCCGTGAMGESLRRWCPAARIVGVDANAAMLDVAARRRGAHYTRLARTEAESLELPPSSIDLAVLAFGFHDLGRPAEAMERVAAALRPGGRLLGLELTLPDGSTARGHYVRALTAAAGLRDRLGVRRAGHVIDEILATPPHSHLIGTVEAAGFHRLHQRSHGYGMATSYLFRKAPRRIERPSRSSEHAATSAEQPPGADQAPGGPRREEPHDE